MIAAILSIYAIYHSNYSELYINKIEMKYNYEKNNKQMEGEPLDKFLKRRLSENNFLQEKWQDCLIENTKQFGNLRLTISQASNIISDSCDYYLDELKKDMSDVDYIDTIIKEMKKGIYPAIIYGVMKIRGYNVNDLDISKFYGSDKE